MPAARPVRRPSSGLLALLAFAALPVLSVILGRLPHPLELHPVGALTFGFVPGSRPVGLLLAKTLLAVLALALALWLASTLLGGQRPLARFVVAGFAGRCALLPVMGLFALPGVAEGLAHLFTVEDGRIVATGARLALPLVAASLLVTYAAAVLAHLWLFRWASRLEGGRLVLGFVLGAAAAEGICRGVGALL